MSVFPNWQQFAVHQRRPETGCIPAGYEMILRAVDAQGVDFDSFQDDFDLDKDRKQGTPPRNHFGTVAAAVAARYPNILFRDEFFPKGSGAKKLLFIEDQPAQQRPILISLANAPFGQKGWHILPVVDADEKDLVLLNFMHAGGRIELLQLPKIDLVSIHETCGGGEDVAYLKAWQRHP